jgi:hypothetical protein
MKCENCGAKITENQMICPSCGLELSHKAEKTVNSAVTQPGLKRQYIQPEPQPEMTQPGMKQAYKEPTEQSSTPREPAGADASAQSPQRKKPGKGLLIGLLAGGLAVIAAVVVLLVLHPWHKSDNNRSQEADAPVTETIDSVKTTAPEPEPTSVPTPEPTAEPSHEQSTNEQFTLSLPNAEKNGKQDVVAAGDRFVVGIKPDGTCITSGTDVPDVSGWTNIIAVSSNRYDVAGLRSDGTVLCSDSRLDVSGLKNIIQIDYNAESRVDGDVGQHLVGLTSSQTVVAVGTNQYGDCNTSEWSNIVDVAAGFYHTVGLRSDGTVVACGNNQQGQCNVAEWKDIIDVAAARYATYGLTADGKILIAGQYEDFVPEVPHWDGVVAIIAGNEGGSARDFVIGICRDGTIKTNREGYVEERDFGVFSNVQAVAASSWGYTVCVDRNGVVKQIGYDVEGTRNVSNWPLLKSTN